MSRDEARAGRAAHERRARAEMFRFLGMHLAAGTVGGVLIGGLLLWSDLGGIYTLMAKSKDAALWLFLLFGSLIVTFGAVGMGIGIMGKAEESDE